MTLERRVSVTEAARVLRDGGIVLYPTDTTYALAVDALDPAALRRLVRLKGRGAEKALSVVVPDEAAAERLVHLTPRDRQLLRRLLPGPYTLVFRHKGNLPAELVGAGDTLALRIPDRPEALALAREARVPITATSANRSGDPPAYSPEEFLARYEDSRTDLQHLKVLDGGPIPRTPPSTLLDCTGPEIEVLRAGAGPWPALQGSEGRFPSL